MEVYADFVFMKSLKIILACFALVFSISALAQKKQEPPARRLGLDPAGRTKVVNVVSRSYIRGNAARSSEKIERDVLNSNSINRNNDGCTVNVGTPAITEGVQGIGSRYGTSHNDQVTVVRGSVINVCK